MRKISYASVGIVAVAILLASGCSQRYAAERDGKKAGQAMCDLKNATTKDEATNALNDVNKQLDDLANKYSLATAEDRKDVQNNLADLAEHTVQGNDALRQQDLAVLQRSIRHIADDSSERATVGGRDEEVVEAHVFA